ncbi:ATP-dependent RNA helicase DBP2 [Fusarium oxysporum f. sp. albedinis]|nr:ATP-dependent RNA helicase DBP2 [Fusarium oxysporum f. sp. albedinis]
MRGNDHSSLVICFFTNSAIYTTDQPYSLCHDKLIVHMRRPWYDLTHISMQIVVPPMNYQHEIKLSIHDT